MTFLEDVHEHHEEAVRVLEIIMNDSAIEFVPTCSRLVAEGFTGPKLVQFFYMLEKNVKHMKKLLALSSIDRELAAKIRNLVDMKNIEGLRNLVVK